MENDLSGIIKKPVIKTCPKCGRTMETKTILEYVYLQCPSCKYKQKIGVY